MIEALNPNYRALFIGAVLPPFGHKYMIEVHIDDGVEIKFVKDLIADLQGLAPQLYTNAMVKRK